MNTGRKRTWVVSGPGKGDTWLIKIDRYLKMKVIAHITNNKKIKS